LAGTEHSNTQLWYNRAVGGVRQIFEPGGKRSASGIYREQTQ